jgi:hypothetical protein
MLLEAELQAFKDNRHAIRQWLGVCDDFFGVLSKMEKPEDVETVWSKIPIGDRWYFLDELHDFFAGTQAAEEADYIKSLKQYLHGEFEVIYVEVPWSSVERSIKRFVEFLPLRMLY